MPSRARCLNALANEGAFTLLEIIVVVLLLGFISSITFTAMANLMKSKDLVLSQRKLYNDARYIFDRLNREFSAMETQPLPTSDQQSQQTSGKRNAFLNAEDIQSSNADTDAIRFITSQGSQYFFNASTNGDLTELYYHLVESQDSADEDRNQGHWQKYTLVREEAAVGTQASPSAEKKKVIFPISENIISLNFSYALNGKWLSQWQDPYRLPEAIQVTLSMQVDESPVEEFQTAFAISAGKGARTSYDQFLQAQ